jgi:hypothetical protein
LAGAVYHIGNLSGTFIILSYDSKTWFFTHDRLKKKAIQVQPTLDTDLWLLRRLTPDARDKLLKKIYEALFDKAQSNVRAWEKANINQDSDL